MRTVSFKTSSWWAALFIVLFFILGASIRLGPLIHKDYWEDELATISFATELPSVQSQLISPVDDRPPLFYLFIRLLIHFSTSEVFLRFPSFVFSLMCIPLSYFLFQKWSKILALCTAVAVTLSPFFVEYGWQLRDYGALLPITLVTLKIVFLVFEKVSNHEAVPKKYVLWVGLLSTLGLLINYIYLFFIISFLLSVTLLLLGKNKNNYQIILHLWLIHLLPFLLILQYLLRQQQVILRTTGWIPSLSAVSMENLITAITGIGFTFDESFILPPIWTKAIAYVSGTIYIFLALWIWGSKKISYIVRVGALLGPLVFCLNLLLVWITSLVIERSLFLPRTFLPSAVLMTVSGSIYLFFFFKYILRRHFVFLPLFLIILTFMSFCYWDSYFGRNPLLFFDERLKLFQTNSELISVLKNKLTTDTQIIFLPRHYQSFYTSAYFPTERKKVSKLADELVKELEEKIADNFVNKEASTHIVLAVYKLVLTDNTNYYSKEYLEFNKQLLSRVDEMCNQSFSTTTSLENFVVYECKIVVEE